jgi:hypothetical protein
MEVFFFGYPVVAQPNPFPQADENRNVLSLTICMSACGILCGRETTTDLVFDSKRVSLPSFCSETKMPLSHEIVCVSLLLFFASLVVDEFGGFLRRMKKCSSPAF